MASARYLLHTAILGLICAAALLATPAAASDCALLGIRILDCSPEAARWEPALATVPFEDRAAVHELEVVPLMRSGRYTPAARRIQIGEWATERDLWHEVGHALFVGNRDGYPTAGGLTTLYGQSSPDEDVAECYAEILARTYGCDGARLGWIDRHSGVGL